MLPTPNVPWMASRPYLTWASCGSTPLDRAPQEPGQVLHVPPRKVFLQVKPGWDKHRVAMWGRRGRRGSALAEPELSGGPGPGAFSLVNSLNSQQHGELLLSIPT